MRWGQKQQWKQEQVTGANAQEQRKRKGKGEGVAWRDAQNVQE